MQSDADRQPDPCAGTSNSGQGAAPPPPPPPSAPFGDARPPFGGAPVEKTPSAPPRSRRPLLTCLGVLIVFGIAIVALGFFFLAQVEEFVGGAQPRMSRSENTVGLVRIENVILDDRRTLDVIDYYARKKGIQAVLVRIDSPGGGVGASQEIYEAILRLRDDGKSVVVSMGSMAASGGYYVACAADEVFTNPGTLTGSIGVIIGIPNFKKIADKIGFEYQVVKSGKFKDIASTTRPLTDEERELMQGLIDDVYNQFLEAILENRTPQIEKALAALDNDELTSLTGGSVPRSAEAFLRAIADGRILTGRQAVRYGLVDYEGTQQEALDRVAELAGLEEPELYEYKPRRPLSELFEAGAKSALENTGLPIHGMRIEYRLPY